MVIGIIGGGASGMAAALAASQNSHAQVVVLERQARVGRKLLATGNGRCNLTNTHCAPDYGYHGEDSAFAHTALTHFGWENTLDWFASMGLLTVTEDSGRVYPYSDQANSVVDVLRFAMDKPNIRIICGCEITKIHRECGGFRVTGTEETFFFDKLIVACGGLAGTKLGGSMSGYKLLRSMGHRVTKLRPALVQLKSSWTGVAALKGIRANCHARVFRNGALFAQSAGQLQFTEYGLSGPVIFELSRDVCQGGGDWICRLDFLPEISEEALLHLLQSRCANRLPAQELLTGILHNRLGRVLVQAAGIDSRLQTLDLTQRHLQAVISQIKDMEIELTEPMGMDSAQVTAGGILTEDFNGSTMESKLVPGLYACGEVLDIDGDCGGYNLQWAWSSGRLAGTCAGEIE